MVTVMVSGRMRHLLPRPMLSVDPHLQVDDAIVLRLTRQTTSLTLELSEGRHLLAVVPSRVPDPDVAARIEMTGLIRSEVGCWVEIDQQVQTLSVHYRPFPVQAWMTRGRLSVEVTRGSSTRSQRQAGPENRGRPGRHVDARPGVA